MLSNSTVVICRRQLLRVFVVAAVMASSLTVAVPAVRAVDSAVFGSPSGNIVCSMTSRSAFCDVADRDWVGPPVQGDPLCGLGEADRVVLPVGQPAAIHCRNDTLITSEDFILAYGQSQTVGPLTCTSEPSGMTCIDSDTGHYFRVSRQTYQLS